MWRYSAKSYAPCIKMRGARSACILFRYRGDDKADADSTYLYALCLRAGFVVKLYRLS